MMPTNVAEMMFGPHALTASRNQARLRLPAFGAQRFPRKENGTIQLDAIEADITADLRVAKMRLETTWHVMKPAERQEEIEHD